MATVDTKTSVNTYLKNLIHYIHQNFLVASKFILSRLADKMAPNLWVSNLRKVVEDKLSLPIKDSSQAHQMLRVNLQNSENIIKNIIRAN